MKILILIFIPFLAIQFTLFAQAPNIEWTKTFGGIENAVGTVVIETSDNGYFVGGNKNLSTYLVRLNHLGDSLWTKLSDYSSGDEDNVVPDLYELKIDDYMLGFRSSFGGLLRVKSQGDSIQYYPLILMGQRRPPKFTHLCKTNDGNYILSIWGGWNDLGRLLMADSLGNEIWEKTFFNKPIRYVIQTHNGGFATIGIEGDFSASLGVSLQKHNFDGEIIWSKIIYADTSFSNNYKDVRSECLLQAADGGYYILCNGQDESAENYNIILFRTNEFGDTLWTRKYGGSGIDRGEYFTKTPDGGYLIVGSTESFGAGGSDVWLVKTDSLGNTEWTKTIGGTEDDYGKYVQVTSDSGYIVTGGTHSYGQGDHDVWVIKLTHNPVSVDNTMKIVEQYELSQNFPNPLNPSTKIRYSLPQLSKVVIKVYDILGREIVTLVNEEKQTGTYDITWYAENLPSGVYFYRIQAGDYVKTKKMVLLK